MEPFLRPKSIIRRCTVPDFEALLKRRKYPISGQCLEIAVMQLQQASVLKGRSVDSISQNRSHLQTRNCKPQLSFGLVVMSMQSHMERLSTSASCHSGLRSKNGRWYMVDQKILTDPGGSSACDPYTDGVFIAFGIAITSRTQLLALEKVLR